jgi:hypothetical protein
MSSGIELLDARGVSISPGDRCRWPGHEDFTAEQRKIYGCKSKPEPEPDACGHGDNPDEGCDGCYG